ncbi:MAG TPA: biotin--[acetyl-CoA-carboxylase] ligase [Terriglobales bacterium]|nr:biotin--[acetyl-CoA-carboxylase] ligase [Terriglobales bacterium]
MLGPTARLPHNPCIKALPKIRRARRRHALPEPEARTDGRIGRIVRLLTDHAMVVVSGTKLAEELSTSRSAVWRLVQQLRGMGVEIAGHPATGYRLKSVPDLLLPEFVKPLVKGTLFAERIHHYFRIGSTNAEAMNAAARGEPEGSVFIAEEQTAGRGRGGHSWVSERSAGIYCSVVLRPEISPADTLAISLVAGLAVRAAVQEVTSLVADLRWPNDVLLAGKKFCGILIEMNAEPTRVRYLVLGIGLNVNQNSFPSALENEATSLRLETGRTCSRVELAAALLKSLHREYRALASGRSAQGGKPIAEVIRRFEDASSSSRGRQVRIEEEGGYEGVTEGLDASGFLRVRTASGMRTVISGGVRTIEPLGH